MYAIVSTLPIVYSISEWVMYFGRSIQNYIIFFILSGIAAFCWVYEKVITDPLRVLYYVGPVWQNKSPAEMCYILTGMTLPQTHWTDTDYNKAECAALLERQFKFWSNSFYSVFYFTVVFFVVSQLLWQTWRCLNPFGVWRRFHG